MDEEEAVPMIGEEEEKDPAVTCPSPNSWR